MQVPIWLTLGVAALVAGFGCYRVWLAFKKPATAAEDGRSALGRGMYRMSPRMHLAIGAVYILLGTALGATSFGWNPLSSAFR